MTEVPSLRAVVVILAGAITLGACGGEEQPQGTGGGALPPLTVAETEFALEPANTRLPRAGRIRITATNRGRTVHALALVTSGGPRSTERIEPGASQTLTVDLKPGSYAWYCPVGDHRRRGMRGVLIVAGDAREREGRAAPDKAPSGGYGY